METTPEAAALNKSVAELVGESGLVVFELDDNIIELANHLSGGFEDIDIGNDNLDSAGEFSDIVGLSVLHFRSASHTLGVGSDIITGNGNRFESGVVLSIVYTIKTKQSIYPY